MNTLITSSHLHADYQVEPHEAVRKIFDAKGWTNRYVAEQMGIREQNLSNMINNNGRSLSDKMLVKMSKAIDVPFDTLRYGKDIEQYLKEVSKPKVDELLAVDKFKLGKLIPAKRAQLYFSELPEKDAEQYIPYYDVEITAGKIELYFDDVEEMPEGYIYAPQYRDCVACNVKGDSMYDKIFPGSRLYVYHLKNKKYIDFGQIYLIVLDGHRLLKYIDPDPNDEARVVLRSHNRQQYKDWPVEKQDIIHLFLVKGYENQNAN